MSPVETRLSLVPATPEQLLSKWQGPDGAFPPEISPSWIEKLRAATAPDPWVLGFLAVDRETMTLCGSGGFKGEPGPDGVVEIAYGIDDAFQRRGYATEVAAALVAFAFADSRVRLICAHTLPDAAASARVLEKCGFARVPDVIDPEDGPLWRFERGR
jgi:RimJ/RimL family protein N-acetyltransferase